MMVTLHFVIVTLPIIYILNYVMYCKARTRGHTIAYVEILRVPTTVVIVFGGCLHAAADTPQL